MKSASPRAQTLAVLALSAGSLLATAPAHAQAKEAEPVLNLYSARHYQTDEVLYKGFTDATGIRINRIELGDAPLLERLRSEGARSPADVVMLVDASRLAKAREDGLFQPVKTPLLEKRIPAAYRSADGSWYGFSTRARVIIYNPAKLKPEQVDTYEKLADPSLKGMLCIRSGSHPYNLSLFGSMVAHDGEERTRALLKGLVANMARDPKGGDTDQIKAVASGECGVAVSNSYYYARMMRSDKPADQEVVAKTRLVWPNQAASGTHMNLAGAGVARYAPHREAAVKFLEYLASDQAQQYFAGGNNEWPAVAGVSHGNPALDKLGPFKPDLLPVEEAAARVAKAQMILDEVNFR